MLIPIRRMTSVPMATALMASAPSAKPPTAMAPADARPNAALRAATAAGAASARTAGRGLFGGLGMIGKSARGFQFRSLGLDQRNDMVEHIRAPHMVVGDA